MGLLIIAGIFALLIGGMIYYDRNPGFWEAQRRRKAMETLGGIAAGGRPVRLRRSPGEVPLRVSQPARAPRGKSAPG